MIDKNVKYIITDFDGTLVDTFDANYNSYKDVLAQYGYDLEEDTYRRCFGLRFDKFMDEIGVEDKDLRFIIKAKKAEAYKTNLYRLKLNDELYNFIKYQHDMLGTKTAIASTAARKNLENAIEYLNIRDVFDYIISGEDVTEGKPNPEVYLKALEMGKVNPEDAIIFEDSEVGCKAAQNAKIQFIKIDLSA